MAQLLVPTALEEDLGFISSTTWWVMALCNSSSRGPAPHLTPEGPCLCEVHTHMRLDAQAYSYVDMHL